MAAVPVDQESAVTLAGARAEARDALNQFRSEYQPSGPPSMTGGAKAPGPGVLPTEEAPNPTADVASADNGAAIPGIGTAEPAPPPSKAITKPEDNGEMNVSSAMHFLRDSFKGTGTEVANAVPRALARLGGWLTNAAAGAVFAGEKVFGSQKHYEDAVFDFKKNYIDTAVDYWTPERAAQTGEGNGTGGGAQAIGNAAEMVPGIVTGGAGLLAQIFQGSTDTAMQDIEQGKSVKQAIADGTVDGLATWLMSKFGMRPSKYLLRRVIKSAGASSLIQMGANVVKAGINKAFGDPNAPTPDLLQGVDEAAIIGGLFGIKGHTTLAEKGKAANRSGDNSSAPPPSGSQNSGASPDQSAAPNPTPTPTGQQGQVAPVPSGTGEAGTPVTTSAQVVPDKPSVEPLKDIKAQFKDMNDASTPRLGVLVTPETQTHMTMLGDKTLEQAKKQGRTVDFPQGTLVLKTKGDVIKVNQRVKAGEDPQSIIGTITGAGTGKTPDATAVVQGRDETGAVAAETTVRPEDVPVAAQKMEDQGKTPVVTTPQEAVARRVDERNKEVEAQSAAREPVATTEATPVEPEHESNETPTAPPPRMALVQLDNGKEAAAHVEEGAPEGKVRVRPINAEGESEATTVDLPKERVKESAPSQTVARDSESRAPTAEPTEARTAQQEGPKESAEVTTVSEPAKEPSPVAPPREKPAPAPERQAPTDTSARKPTSALESLPQALATHEQQERKEEGYAKSAKLSERQDNASAFAAVLARAAEESRGRVPEAVSARAANAAKAAINLTLKSKNATEKGQGTSHARVDALNTEMHRAARELLGKGTEADKEPAVAPKAAALKKRIEKAKAAAKEPAKEPAKKPVKKAKSIEEVVTPQERQRTNKLMQEYIAADFDEHPKAHEKLLAHLHELADKHDEFPRDQIDTFMHFLMEQREAAHEGKTGRMSDTLEPEEHEFEEPDEGFSRTSAPIIDEGPGGKARTIAARHRLNMEWANLTDALDKSNFFSSLDRFRDTGEPLGSHFLLDKMLEHVQTPILKTLLTNIRSRVPDAPVYNSSSIIHLGTGEKIGGGKASGVYNLGANAIQFNFVPEEGFRPFQMRGVVHEMIHAGTLAELRLNEHGELSQRMENALNILKQRLANKYGEEALGNWLNYFRDRTGNVQRPEGESLRHLYGLTNTAELATEVLTNPEFIREIAESEDFASPRESFMGNVGSLITRIFRAIGEFFGIKDAKLLQHIVDTTFQTMEANRKTRPQVYDKRYTTFHNALPDAVHAALQGKPLEEAMLTHAFNLIDEPSPPIRGVDSEIAKLSEGSEMHATVRDFVHVFKSRAIDTMKKTVIALKTVGQIYRDHLKDFGHDDSTNPLRGLQEADIKKQGIIHKLKDITESVAKKWTRLNKEDDLAVSQLMIDTTMYKLDPRKAFADQALTAKSPKGAEARHAEFQQRYNKLSPEAREVYNEATDANRKLIRAQRRAGVDTALEALDAKLSDAQRSLLYGAQTPEVFDSLIGKGKLIDVGDTNDKLKASLRDFAGFTEIEGPYHHLGRQGDFVVSVEPEGTRDFDSRSAAEEFSRRVTSLSPNSRAKVAERGGRFAVDYKAQYVSMHGTKYEAEQDAKRMSDLGFEVGNVTQKTLGNAYGALSHGMQELVTEAQRKIQKGKEGDAGTQALVDSLKSAFLQMQAARSAYAGSKLARKNVGGVKAADMRRNFAEHAISAGWHTANMQTVFERAEHMAKLRSMARDARGGASQTEMYRRGEVVSALNAHTANEVATFGQKAPLNAMMAKLGFMSFLASPSHAAIWMTQNFTTGIPYAGARWGYGKATSSFGRAMTAVTGPSIRASLKAAMGRGATSEEVHQVLLDAIAKHPTFGKWASGSNSHLRQLFDRGVISHSYANELGSMAQGPSMVGKFAHGYDRTIERVFGWARVLPGMADSINRLSTALAGLEMTGGDIRQTSDLVEAVHADYSAGNKPLAFKKLGKLPGANSITMFKTYVQAMAHMLYSNLLGSIKGENKAVAAKTFAGLVIGNALFAGVAAGVGIEPLRLALYAYHKLADEEGDVWDFRNAVHRFLNEHFGRTAGDLLAGGPLTRIFNVDVSHRMGLSDLFFHDPPDLITKDQDVWFKFLADQLGPMPQELVHNVTGFTGNMQRGNVGQAISTVIPVKAYQDAAKALELMQTGKQDSLGGQLTQPSAADALIQAIGFKPAAVAEAQERQGVKIEYAQAARAAKKDIVGQYVKAYFGGGSAGDRAKAQGRMDRWNRNNPTVPITNKDINAAAKAAIRTTYGLPEKNEKAEEALNY